MANRVSEPRQVLFDGLETAVAQGVVPGCVALVWVDGAVLYHEAHGVLATDEASSVRHVPVTRETAFDLASLTKILCTTTLAAIAVGEGRLQLDQRIPETLGAGCPTATLCDLLEHAAGLSAHVEYFVDVPAFSASGVVDRVIAQPPAYRPREQALYSDLGFILLGAWLERVFEAPLDRVFDDRVAHGLSLDRDPTMSDLGFRPLASRAWLAPHLERRIAPTEVYRAALHPDVVPSYVPIRDDMVCAHGVVHDDNAFVMGGVAGHAGLFGTASAVLDVAQAWFEARLGFAPAVRDRFWTPSTVVGSTRALGFTAGPPVAQAGETSMGWGHTGFTGTSVWIEPHATSGPRITVLLSNRVHPTRRNNAIGPFRAQFQRWAARL